MIRRGAGPQGTVGRFVPASCVAVVVASVAFCGPADLEPADQEAILSWLVCDECTAGERDTVVALGRAAVPYLFGVLDSVPPHIIEPLRNRLANRWTAQIQPDSAAYVDTRLNNVRSTARIRAALSLGDLEAEKELQRALDWAVARGYREDVLGALRGQIAAAQDSVAAVSAVRVSPAEHTMTVGESLQFSASIEDAYSNLLQPTVTWASSDSAVANVSDDGTVTAAAAGAATLTARSIVNPEISGTSRVTITETRAQTYIVRILSGNGQAGAEGTATDEPLLVVVTDTSGNPVPGVAVSWQVLLGGGTVAPIAAGEGRLNVAVDVSDAYPPGVTNAEGVAAASLLLGQPGPQRVEARVADSPAVVFRATANQT